MVSLLREHGIDTRGLEPTDLSLSEGDASAALFGQDLASAVAQLAAQLSAKLAAAQKQCDAHEAQTDKLLAAADVASEEFSALVADCDDLRAKVSELQELLELANRRATSSEDNVSSEVQALEEENIELMRENRELRKDLANLKAERRGGAATASAVTAVPAVSAPVAPKSHGKENQPLTQLNAAAAAPGSDKKRLLGADVVKPSPAAGLAAAPMPAGDEGSKVKKTTHKKAKPLVSAVGQDAAALETGDCAQS